MLKRKAERRGEAMGQEFPLGQEILLGIMRHVSKNVNENANCHLFLVTLKV